MFKVNNKGSSIKYVRKIFRKTNISNLNVTFSENIAYVLNGWLLKTPERRHWHRSGVFIVNFEYISQVVLVFLLLTLNM